VTPTKTVTLEPATITDAVLIANLLELYIHDLSAFFAVDIGAEGHFGYAKLPLYWSEPEIRFPFLIRVGGQLAGFVLVTRGSPATEDPRALDIAEFFVLRRHRRSGTGRAAARLLWNRMPGVWIVRVSEANLPALPFWESVIGEYTGGDFQRSSRPGNVHPWRVFSFDSVPPDTAA
jgi:predicted acetyltransferase